MNTLIHPKPKRRRFDGVIQIVRYNWSQYVGSLVAILAGSAWLWLGDPNPGWLRLIVWSGALLAAWWCLASLAASHWIYDRSELYRWTWIPYFLPTQPWHWLNLHAGLDESSTTLHELFPASTGRTCDFYDAAEMSEPSIQRARAENTVMLAEHVDHRRLPFPDQAFDAVFLLFAAHELRRTSSRETFFHEIRRVLAPKGTVLLVEHIRDLANFAAFGPGFLHFMRGNEWHRLASIAGLEIVKEQRMTPFVKTILLRRNK
jgi:SAM-dependent methyltransferase